MPDKQNENRFLAMLERRGLVRRANNADAPAKTPAEELQPSPEVDLRSMFGFSADGYADVSCATNQPSQEMLGEIEPYNAQQEEQGHGQQQWQEQREREEQEQGWEQQDQGWNPQEQGWEQQAQNPQEEGREQQEQGQNPQEQGWEQNEQDLQEQGQEQQAQCESDACTDAFADRLADAAFPEEQNPPTAGEMRDDESPCTREGVRDIVISRNLADNYTNQYLEIDELYDVLSMKSNKTETIYLVEEYMRTLPDSLPDESKREIISKIISASGFNYDILIGDGVLRVKMLKEYAERFAQQTDDYVTARDAELASLEQQAIGIRQLIENRRELHKRQFFAIETEAQRLREILTFITG